MFAWRVPGGASALAPVMAMGMVGFVTLIVGDHLGRMQREPQRLNWELRVEEYRGALDEEDGTRMQVTAFSRHPRHGCVVLSEPYTWYGHAVPSPDRQSIAFTAATYSAATNECESAGLYVAQVAYDRRGMPRPVNDYARVADLEMPWAVAFCPSWSRDGRHLSWVGPRTTSAGSRELTVCVADLETGVTRNVTNALGATEATPAFSPTTDRIAFTRIVRDRGQRVRDIFTIGPDGEDLRRVTRTGNAPAGAFACTGWSADGAFILFKDRTAQTDYRIRADGTEPAQRVP